MIPIQHRLRPASAPIQLALRQFAAQMRVALPGIVVAFDAVKQVVSVQPAVNEAVVLDSVFKDQPLPILDDVPVCFPRAGGFALTMPINPGDECLVIFTDVAYDLWWQSGVQSNQPDGVKYRHDIGNGIAVFGLWSQKRLLTAYSPDSVQLRTDDGSVSIDLAPDGIAITAPQVSVSGNLSVGSGASGTFTTSTGQVVMVQDGIIVSME